MNILNKRIITIYIISLFLFSVFFLYQKHLVGNDSTISEWIINYEGGFTKRGLIGQISIKISNLLEIKLRESILIFQIFIVGIYYLLLNDFLKKIELNNLIIFAIFSPIFILYPIAEIEVLARKETFLYSFFLIYLLIKDENYRKIYKIVVLPFLVLIWEPVIFFFPFWFVIDYFQQNKKDIIKFFLKSFYYFIPAVLLAFYIAFNPISEQGHVEMASFLKNKFGENCYMACDLLLHKSSIYDQFHDVIILMNFERIFRYLMILLVGFGPLIILLKHSNFDKNNLKIIYLIIFFPILILFLMMTDWGRVVNMFYTFSILTFLFLYKYNLVEIKNDLLKNFFVKLLNKKKTTIILFIVFSFGWNPKTSIVGDVGSKPGYQIPKKVIKIINYKYIKNF